MLVLGSASAAVVASAQATVPASAALIVSIVSLPCPKLGRALSPAQRIRFGCLIFLCPRRGALLFVSWMPSDVKRRNGISTTRAKRRFASGDRRIAEAYGL